MVREPGMMRAVVVGPGGAISVEARDVPTVGTGEVLVRVFGAGVNRADLLQAAGQYPAPSGVVPDVPGLEFCGVVDGIGEEVDQFAVGDRVMGLAQGGAQAEYIALPAGLCIAIPSTLASHLAAAIPEAYITVYDALVVQANCQPSEVVAVFAVGSGVGVAAIQIGKLREFKVIGSTRTKVKLELAIEAGLSAGIAMDVSNAQFVEALVEAAGGPVDVVLDLLGGRYTEMALEAVKTGGRIVVLGFLDGMTASVSVTGLISKRARIIGAALRGRPLGEREALVRRFAEDTETAIKAGGISPPIAEVVPLSGVVRAYEVLRSNHNFGKVVLDMLE